MAIDREWRVCETNFLSFTLRLFHGIDLFSDATKGFGKEIMPGWTGTAPAQWLALNEDFPACYPNQEAGRAILFSGS